MNLVGSQLSAQGPHAGGALGKASVLIPSYLRSDDLRRTLAKTLQQTYPNVEIIVVDDGTPGPEIEDAVRDFPRVTYLRTPTNIGLIAARNFGAAQCSGEFIVNLDDDSWLEDKDDLARIAYVMKQNPSCGILALNIRVEPDGYEWDDSEAPSEQRTYKGCGNVYRRSLIEQVGGYIPEFYRQGEEVERSLRVMDAGYKVLSCPSIKVFHAQSPINRNIARHLAFEAANYLRRELIRAPTLLLPLGIARAVRWAYKNRKVLDFELYRAELFGKRVPLGSFVRARRAPVRLKTYYKAWRLG